MPSWASTSRTRPRSATRASSSTASPCRAREAAHTVRVRDGERIVADGPFAETKELVGGYYVVDCDTLDQALDAAARIPSARFGAIEVRPIAQM